MDSLFTVGYVVKILLGAAAFLLIRKLIRKFIVKKIDADTEIQLLIYLYKNQTILDFDKDVDTLYSDFMHKFYINNAIYHVEIRIDENDIYHFTIEDMNFTSRYGYVETTQERFDEIKRILKELKLDKVVHI